jgi:hypothetical protein
MVFPMSKIMFQMVSVVFKDVVVLILYFPAGSDVFCQQLNILLGDRFVRYPTVLVDNLVLLPVMRFKKEVIHPRFLPVRPVFNAVYPPVPVFKMAFPALFGNDERFRIVRLSRGVIHPCR